MKFKIQGPKYIGVTESHRDTNSLPGLQYILLVVYTHNVFQHYSKMSPAVTLNLHVYYWISVTQSVRNQPKTMVKVIRVHLRFLIANLD